VSHSLLDLSNGLSGIQVLWTNLGTVHNGVATIQLEGIVQIVQSFLCHLVTRILDPSVRLHQNSRPEVLVGIPPVTGTRCRATGTKNTFVHSIELGTIFLRLEVFSLKLGVSVLARKSSLGCRCVVVVVTVISCLQPGLDGSILFIEIAHVRDQILQDVHVRKRIYFGGSLGVVINVGETRQSVASLNVHGAGTTDSFTATSAKGETGILFVLDLDEGIQNHGTAIIQIHGIRAQIWLLVVLFWVPSIDLKVLDAFAARCCLIYG